MSERKQLTRLEENALWQQAQAFATKVYDMYDQLAEDDKFMVKYRFPSRALNMTSDIAEAAGSILPKDTEYALAQARRELFCIKNVYKYLGTQKIITLDPDFMLEIQKLTEGIDSWIRGAWHDIDELEPKVKAP